MDEQPPQDGTKRRLKELLDAKKKARQDGDTPHLHDKGKGGRLDSAKGSAGYKRRKV
jgi:hypothetical protein